MKARKFPKTVIISWEYPCNDEPYLVANTDVISIADVALDVPVGVYKLMAVKKVTTKAELK